MQNIPKFPKPLSKMAFSLNSFFFFFISVPAFFLLAAAKHRRHHWVGPTGHRLIKVDVNGISGEFLSVQAAVDAVPDYNTVNTLIRISPGYYV